MAQFMLLHVGFEQPTPEIMTAWKEWFDAVAGRSVAHGGFMHGRWLSDEGPQSDIVISSRCRLARNLVGLPFTRHASPDQRSEIARLIADAIAQCGLLEGYRRLDLSDLTPAQRGVLREAHLISPEMERDAHGGSVFLAPDAQISLMVNEEDHLRMQAMETG